MSVSATFRGNFVLLSQCSFCCDIRFQPCLSSSSSSSYSTGYRHLRFSRNTLKVVQNQRSCGKREIACRVNDSHSEPDGDNEEQKEVETQSLANSPEQNVPQSLDGEQLNKFEDENLGQNNELGQNDEQIMYPIFRF